MNGFTSNYHGLTTSYSIDDHMHWTIPFGYSTSYTDYSEEFLDRMLNQLLTVPVKNVLSEMASPASSYYLDTTSCNMVADKYTVRSSCYW